MSESYTKILTNTWVLATWDEYLQAIEGPIYEKAKLTSCTWKSGCILITQY